MQKSEIEGHLEQKMNFRTKASFSTIPFFLAVTMAAPPVLYPGNDDNKQMYENHIQHMLINFDSWLRQLCHNSVKEYNGF